MSGKHGNGLLPHRILVRTRNENRREGLVYDGDGGVNLAFGDRKGWGHAESSRSGS